MKIRSKFTLWISLASLTATVIFTIIIFSEINEELAEFVDQELADIAENIFTEIAAKPDAPKRIPQNAINYPLNQYWLKVTDSSGTVILATKLSEYADLPKSANNRGQTVFRTIPQDQLWIPPDEQDEFDSLSKNKIKLRVRLFTRSLHNTEYSVHLGKPMFLINAEIQEILSELTAGVLITVILILLIAYFVAGRVLNPLVKINSMIKEIREHSLDKRIPTGKSRDELHNLTISLNSMFDRLQYSFERQKSFIGDAAHEMQSPLTILMLGHEEMLSESLPIEVRQELEGQLYSMRRLNRLIRVLLSVARLEQQDTLALETLDLNEIIHTIMCEYRDILNAKRISVSFQKAPLTFIGDRDKLHQLFINIIDNGIKYNDELDGKLTITTEKKDSTVYITISNSGPTIPAEDLPQIFKQFYRVEKSRSQSYGGAGLGLTIVKRIVEMHGGVIEVSSVENTSTFKITLPQNS